MISLQTQKIAREVSRRKQQEWIKGFKIKHGVQATIKMIQDAKRSDTNFAKSVEEMGRIVNAIQNDMSYINDVVPRMKKFYGPN